MDFLPPKGSHLSGVVDWWDGSALTRDPNFERSRRRRRGALWRPEQDYSLTSRQFPPLWAEIFLSMPATFVAMNPMSRYVPLPGFTRDGEIQRQLADSARIQSLV